MGHALIVDDDTDAAEMLAELAVSEPCARPSVNSS
jgi:hypothetical protein